MRKILVILLSLIITGCASDEDIILEAFYSAISDLPPPPSETWQGNVTWVCDEYGNVIISPVELITPKEELEGRGLLALNDMERIEGSNNQFKSMEIVPLNLNVYTDVALPKVGEKWEFTCYTDRQTGFKIMRAAEKIK